MRTSVGADSQQYKLSLMKAFNTIVGPFPRAIGPIFFMIVGKWHIRPAVPFHDGNSLMKQASASNGMAKASG